MLRRKYSVQKSFRIDAQLSEDLEALSEVLERPQNDLVNTALEELMMENKEWFIEYYLIDKLGIFFDHDISTSYNDDDLSIRIEVDDEKQKVVLSYTIHLINEEEVIEYDLNKEGKQRIREELRDITVFLDKDSTKVKEYLKERLNYK